MIQPEALFNISYGLYIICSGNQQNGNGYISNTFFQVSSEPPQFATCCNKDNFTANLIRESGILTASILHQETPAELFGRFGYRSGKDGDKLQGMKVIYGESGTPIVLNDCIAWLECRVVQTLDVGTHWLFVGELIAAEVVNEALIPLTYLYYRQVKKLLAPKNAPTFFDKSKLEKKIEKKVAARHKCAACGYYYDESEEEIPFNKLPDDWVCPICGSEKEDFYLE